MGKTDMELVMEFRYRDTGVVVDEQMFRSSLGSISLPKTLGQYEFDRFRVDPILSSLMPDCNEFQSVERDGVQGDGNGSWYQSWRTVDLPPAEVREVLKAKRAEAVANIKVTVDDMVFDGDEISQARMNRTLKAAELTGLTSTTWTLANDERVTVTVPILSEALAKSILRQGELWDLAQYEAD